MTAATFSSDGSVLAVAAETVITLWDADKNILVAVIGDTLTVILWNPDFHSLTAYAMYQDYGNNKYLWPLSFALKLILWCITI